MEKSLIKVETCSSVRYNILFKNKQIGMFEKVEDGYFYYFQTTNGCYNSAIMRNIANKLDGINKDWDEEVKKIK